MFKSFSLGIGTQIIVGNDLTGGPTSTSNTICTTLTGYGTPINVNSQWISCPSIKGRYLWINAIAWT